MKTILTLSVLLTLSIPMSFAAESDSGDCLETLANKERSSNDDKSKESKKESEVKSQEASNQ
jgi:hypothetical protein